MKNRVVEIDDNVVALEIIYKGTRLLCYIDKVDLPKAALIRGTWHINRNTSGHIDGVKTKKARVRLKSYDKKKDR